MQRLSWCSGIHKLGFYWKASMKTCSLSIGLSSKVTGSGALLLFRNFGITKRNIKGSQVRSCCGVKLHHTGK